MNNESRDIVDTEYINYEVTATENIHHEVIDIGHETIYIPKPIIDEVLIGPGENVSAPPPPPPPPPT